MYIVAKKNRKIFFSMMPVKSVDSGIINKLRLTSKLVVASNELIFLNYDTKTLLLIVKKEPEIKIKGWDIIRV